MDCSPPGSSVPPGSAQRSGVLRSGLSQAGGGRDQKKSKKSSETLTFKRPEGMHREVYALLYSDKKQVLEPQGPRLRPLTNLPVPNS